ncbi:hypothetical protein [Nocardiopsis ganjiahuensis]|uniref:hypothetical protein n=1 Tax=Nocardiopsis ganjiahuensis TaxID=239984 RepID=UPI000365F95A|nr:hypothetical protein [Nocardiopsis ganjiahuensis]
MPPTRQESEDQGPVRPHWLLSLIMALACLAVVASGWSVARLTLGEGTPPPPAEDRPEVRPPSVRAVDLDPADAELFLELAAQELRTAPAFHMSYTQSVDGDEAGHGWARHRPGSDTAFEHYFRTASGVQVYRYDLPGAGFTMTAEKGMSGMTVLESPSEADRRLCSAEFVLGFLDDLVDSATGVELVGTEEITLSEGVWGSRSSTHTTHRYTGTFESLAGGYQQETGHNTLTRITDADFDLWVDEQGHPRRLSYTSPDGFGETYDYHALS